MSDASTRRGARGEGDFAATAAMATGLCVGFADIALGALPAPDGLGSVAYAAGALAATTASFAALYAAVWFAVLAPTSRRFGLQRPALAISFAFSVLTMFVLGRFIGASLEPNGLLRWAVVCAVTAVVATGVYQLRAAFEVASRRSRAAARVITAVPFVAAVTMVFVWMEIYRVGAFASAPSVLLCVVYVVVTAAVILWFRGARSTRVVPAGIGALFVFVVVSGAMGEYSLHRIRNRPPPFNETRHAVRHVFLITIDTLRRDALSCYDPEDASTPHIDRVARDAVVYERAYSAAPWTLPSLSTIVTGASPFAHGAVTTMSRLSGAFKTLPEYMRDSGYRTAGVGNSGILTPQYNVARGLVDNQFYPRPRRGATVGEAILQRASGSARVEVSTADLTDMAVDWIERNRDSDSFMWIHYLDPHQPYEPPPDYRPTQSPPELMGYRFMISNVNKVPLAQVPGPKQREWVRGLYDGEVRYVDHNVGRFVDALVNLGIYDESLIVLTSDHGEEFWEHGRFEHGHSLYEELVRVPLLIKLPSSDGAGTCDEVVSNGSILPTIAEVCGIECADSIVSYPSLASTWATGAESRADAHVLCTGVMYYQQKEAVVFHDRKYIRSLATGRRELYDLAADPHERHTIYPLPSHDRELLEEMLSSYCSHEWDLHDRVGAGHERITGTDETLEHLRALGYM